MASCGLRSASSLRRSRIRPRRAERNGDQIYNAYPCDRRCRLCGTRPGPGRCGSNAATLSAYTRRKQRRLIGCYVGAQCARIYQRHLRFLVTLNVRVDWRRRAGAWANSELLSSGRTRGRRHFVPCRSAADLAAWRLHAMHQPSRASDMRRDCDSASRDAPSKPPYHLA
jgi:hypothetical protein